VRLEASWAGTFYQELFCRIDEGPFADGYSDEASRPNLPVNVLVGLETVKASNRWSDEEAYDHFCFDVQVREALRCRDLSEGHFELRTMYNFRQRLGQHMQETGENLFGQVFEQISDEQLATFKLKMDKLRMESTMIASNIRETTRVQLWVEVLQRVHRRVWNSSALDRQVGRAGHSVTCSVGDCPIRGRFPNWSGACAKWLGAISAFFHTPLTGNAFEPRHQSAYGQPNTIGGAAQCVLTLCNGFRVLVKDSRLAAGTGPSRIVDKL